MVNKKGFIKTLEAIIAIVVLIIFVFSIAAISIKTSQEPPGNVVDAQNFILRNVLNNDTLINAVLSKDPAVVFDLVSDVKPAGYGHGIQFCDLDGTCDPLLEDLDLPEKTVYVSSVYVVDTAAVGNQVAANDPVVLKVFMWEE